MVTICAVRMWTSAFPVIAFGFVVIMIRTLQVLSFKCAIKHDMFRQQGRSHRWLTTPVMLSQKDTTNKKYTKSNLPQKICVVCNRPFDWRKKWEKVWDEVKYCSERCRRSKSKNSADIADSDNIMLVPRVRANRDGIKSNNAMIPRSIGANVQSLVRRGFTTASLLLTTAAVFNPGSIPLARASPTTSRKEEVAKVFKAMKFPDEFEEPFTDEAFKRLDESDDSQFYQPTRFVEHIDAPAVQALTAYHDRVIRDAQVRSRSTTPSIDVLDLCSSWVSHISADTPTRSVVGVGMNGVELQKNAKLTAYNVQDLNKNPVLQFPDHSFDIVLIQLSIDYLTKPINVLREARRVLRDDGAIYIR